jgi:uncharacterized membrane protein YhaH (DUF805 family)
VAQILSLIYTLAIGWALASLAFRRAADAGLGGWVATLPVVPMLQLPVIAVLSVLPTRAGTASAPQPVPGALEWSAAAQGLVAGVALTVLAVAVGALVFGTYGYGMFVASPLVIGMITAYLANRRQVIDGWDTAKLVSGALALGAAMLVAFALEGVVCIVMAAPLALGVALLGGLLGRALALYSRRPMRETISGVAVLPLVFAAELLLPPAMEFDARMEIGIDASPQSVWRALIDMQEIEAPASLPFRLGVAFPVRGEVVGEGVGALRRGTFSTGTAIERVTVWEPDRKLAFTVVSDVPAMRELSPYQDVHAPHVIGYFRTISTSFELKQRLDGGTILSEHTRHELRLEPVFYWLPPTRWIVRLNNGRVMMHVKRQAEKSGS